jgi:hypothetical protein
MAEASFAQSEAAVDSQGRTIWMTRTAATESALQPRADDAVIRVYDNAGKVI